MLCWIVHLSPILLGILSLHHTVLCFGIHGYPYLRRVMPIHTVSCLVLVISRQFSLNTPQLPPPLFPSFHLYPITLFAYHTHNTVHLSRPLPRLKDQPLLVWLLARTYYRRAVYVLDPLT